MKTKSKLSKFIIPGLLMGAGVLTVAPVAAVLSSCTTTQSKSVVVVENKQYTNNESQHLTGSNYVYPTYIASTSYTTLPTTQASIQSLYDNAKAAKDALTKIDTTNLSTNEKIWLQSYETQWDIKIKNIENGLVYLGANPMVAGSRTLSSRNNTVATNIKDAINIYDLNDETGDPDTTKPNSSLIKNINTKIDEAITFIKSLQGYLNDGMQLGIMPSNLSKKSFIKQTLQFFYQDEIDKKLTSDTNPINVVDLFRESGASSSNTTLNYLTSAFAKTYKAEAQKIGFTNATIDTKLQELTSTLNDFMYFYCGDYYRSTNSYGGENTDLTLSKTNNDNKEVEQTLSLANGTSVYGVGFTQTDLTTPNIGLGFMKIVAGATNISNTSYSGNNIYDQMLYSNNSINTTAETIYSNGTTLTNKGTVKMKSIAKNVITDILSSNTNDFGSTKIQYTSDPFSTTVAEQTLESITKTNTSSTDAYFTQFNAWLNQEDFFFGREKTNTDKLVEKYWTNASNDPTLAKYKNVIVTQGYQQPWESVSHINGSNVTVSGKQALAGAVSSLESYTQFKDSVNSLYYSYFNKIDDYVLSPYNYDIREDIGVGMEGPRGSKQFQYNADPYYSLQKWSVASLTTHEGAMGHHTQQEYWTEYMQGTKKGVVTNENATPGYTFVNDAYHEGWAVFTEWFAAEIGTYGTWAENTSYDGDTLPTNWVKNTSSILSIADENNPTEAEINFIKSYQGGVYYNLVSAANSSKSDKENAVNATKLANMLAYYGFLNESQLRNMRMALDTAVHHKNNNNVSNNGTNDASTTLPYGASIKQERDYMKANSGLGAGDIASESIRYASMPSQATGYMLGKTIFNGLYSAVKSKVTTENKTTNPNYNFAVDGKATIKKLFDLMLRNGEIPLQVMIDFVNSEFGVKYSPSNTANNK